MHFQFAAPEGLDYAVNRYRREAERHYQVLNDHLAGRDFIVGDTLYNRRHVGLGLARPRLARAQGRRSTRSPPSPTSSDSFETVDARPAVARARAVGKDHDFKKVNDEETKRALFPSNYPPAA